MFRYLLTLVLLSTVACSGGGHSSDQQEAGGVAVSLQWPPSISGAVHTSAFGLASGVSSIDMTIDFFGSDFGPDHHTILIERLSDGTEQTTVDGLSDVPEPDGARVTFDVLAGLNRGIFISGVALLEGGGAIAFSGLRTFNVDLLGTTVTVDLRDGDARPQPPVVRVNGADSPVVGGILLLSGEASFPDGTLFQDTITNVTSSDPLVAEVDPLEPTTVNLLAAGSVTLTVELAFGGPVILPLDVTLTLEPPAVDMSGTWTVVETPTLGSELCPRASLDPMTVIQDGNGIAVDILLSDLTTATLTGQITGLEFSWTDQTYPQDLGTTTESVTGVVTSDGLNFLASRSWSWTEGNPLTDCTGTSTLDGAKNL